MAFYGDPDELERIAGVIERNAEQVRDHGRSMVAQGEGMRWKSIAADRCRETLAGDQKSLNGTAGKFDEAAAALRGHARTVRELIAAIARIRDQVVNWFNNAIDRFNQALQSFYQSMKDMASAVGDALGFGGDTPQPPRPPWEGWKYQPGSLPPVGDKEWLDVGRFMSAQGVR
jgi:uncharacterized protein YukE